MAKNSVQTLKATPARSLTHKVVKKAKPEAGLVFEDRGMRSVHRLASALHKAKVINTRTMREYDEGCLTKAPHFDAAAVARIRKNANVSQALFARYLNTSLSSVQKWESGQNEPSGIAVRLLQLVEKHGLGLFD